jgi:hypothetical protein
LLKSSAGASNLFVHWQLRWECFINQELISEYLGKPFPQQPLTPPSLPYLLQAHQLTGSRAKSVAEQQLDIIGGNNADDWSTKAMQAATAAPTTCSTINLREAAPLLVRGLPGSLVLLLTHSLVLCWDRIPFIHSYRFIWLLSNNICGS